MIARIKQLGVVPIPGTTFLYYTRPAYLLNLGSERVRYAYAMKTFAERGIVAAASSDAPVVPANPLIGIQTMVIRTDRLGDAIFPEESIPVEDALRAYTLNAAYATHSERRKGSIQPGYLADITVFDADLRTIDPGTIAERSVAYTIVDGRVVHERYGS
jgi:predicted amidohydrolase YtcJ